MSASGKLEAQRVISNSPALEERNLDRPASAQFQSILTNKKCLGPREKLELSHGLRIIPNHSYARIENIAFGDLQLTLSAVPILWHRIAELELKNCI